MKSHKPERQHPSPPKDPAPAPATLLELRIEKLVTGGDGLARDGDGACFVPRTAPGDLVRVEVVEQRRGYRRAEVRELQEPGPDRCPPPCAHFADCGGCDLQHLTIEAQRRAKAAIVRECFQRQGRLDVEPIMGEPVHGAPLQWRASLRLQSHPTGSYGLFRRGSHDVVRIEQCPVMAAPFAEVILPWVRFLPPVEQVIVRLDGRGGWLVSLFGVPGRLKILKKMVAGFEAGDLPPGLQGVLFNSRPAWGRDYLVHKVAGHSYRVGAASFFQGNQEVAEAAVGIARGWLEQIAAAPARLPHLYDLYGGVGLFTLALGGRFERVTLAEMDAGACRDAENNIARDDSVRGRAVVQQGDLAGLVQPGSPLGEGNWDRAVCVVDPPRAGLGKDICAALLKRRPAHVLYMSCDPATQARDAALLAAGGYRPRELRVLDMFPQSGHVESLLWLEDAGAPAGNA